ncbi:MAG: carbon starvation protein A [Phycisphaerales bacterium]|nr:carbon starvation protein A [Phycisphaerales bacterium]
MSLLALASITIVCLVAGYFLYGTFIARQYRLDDQTTTPAVQRNDGVDFVPTRPFYLLGQHFSAIAAAGPIVGPITACLMFGWGPCVLWIVLGVILIGAVHDFSALVASVRHGAHSIAEIAKVHLGTRAWYALIGFIWLALLYVIVAFTDVTARTFQGLSEELLSVPGAFNKGGAVAASSVIYMGLALLMGVLTRYARMSTLVATIVFVPATLGAVYLGTQVDHLLNFGPKVWYGVILAYCFIASMLPLWLLQQPRGYLGGFVLYLAIGVGLVGVLFGGFEIRQPAWKDSGSILAFVTGGEDAPDMLALMFPFLFVTIACGACSGFHGLICGGTTSKQIERESHCKPVAFGAMLLEGLVALIALATVMIIAQGDLRGRAPGVIYGDGLAMFITRFLDPGALALDDPMRSRVFVLAATFGAMAFSTFVFDTLDVSTRLGRYLLCELTGTTSRVAGGLAAALTAGIPLVVLLAPTTTGAGRPAWMMFWTLFGTANQLLASLTLLGVTVWLYRTGRKYWYTMAPMIFVFGVTMTALAAQILAGARALRIDGFSPTPPVLNAIVGVALLALALVFVVEAWRSVRTHARVLASARRG